MNLDETFMPRGTRPAPSTDTETLVVGAIEERSYVAGPGTRSVVWVSGCHRRCPGCLKPDLFSFEAGRKISVDEVYQRLALLAGVDGVTFSGGEPFEQPLALARLAARLRAIGRNIVIYTGYRHREMVNNGHEGMRLLLAETDILIDGEYREDLENPGRWRGSANQGLVPLSTRGRDLLAAAAELPALQEIQVSSDGTHMRLTGCPDGGFFNRWLVELERRGLVVVPRAGGETK
ncbi:MAG: radical SAM protein [Planctomycetota bacterium]|nr:MAG: radical SAM protein [Planctomycetota bacterium]